MTASATEILSRYGIQLRAYRFGNQKVRCPKCSDQRRNKREPCLSVEIGDEGVRFNCFNCGFHGGEFYDSARPGQYQPRHQPKSSDRAVRNLYR